MSLASLLNAVLFAVVGILLFGFALVPLLRALPGNLWERALKENNMSAAIIAAAVTLALAWIVASAVH